MSQYRSTVKDRLHLGFKSEVRRDARSPAIEAGLNLRGMVSPGEKIPPRYNSPLTARRFTPCRDAPLATSSKVAFEENDRVRERPGE